MRDYSLFNLLVKKSFGEDNLRLYFFHGKKALFHFFHVKKTIPQNYELLFHISLRKQSLGRKDIF